MPEYRTPLPGILAGLLEGAVNRVLALDENTPARLRRLSGRHLQLDIAGSGITLFFSFDDRRVRVRTRLDSAPDTVISGSPQALFAMAVPDGANGWQSGDSRVNITGDANLARDLERLFSQLDPDWEGSLSRVFGDVLGYQVSAGLRNGARQARAAAGEAGEMVDDYLRSGQAPVVHASEFAAFGKSLDELESTLQRIEDRLDRQQDKDR
jgi:ubiquinone biosynthesis protein UbiJ